MRALTGLGSNSRYCGISGLRDANAQSRRDDTMRAGTPSTRISPRSRSGPKPPAPGASISRPGRALDVEVYNPAYFRQGAACAFVAPARSCFEPIYGVDCLDTAELTYQPAGRVLDESHSTDVIAEDIPGAVAARSAVFGFPPVYFNPSEIKPAIEYILFDEWQLPRRP